MTFSLLTDGRAHWDLREEHWNWIPAPESCAVLRDNDGTVLSICRLFSRKLNSFEVQFDAYGVGGVYTHPDHRKKGNASALILKLCLTLWGGTAAALCLYARNGVLYQRNGFVEVQHGLYARALQPGLTFQSYDWRLPELKPWQVWPEGHF